VRCLAHIINLVVQDILREIKGEITIEELQNIEQTANDTTNDDDEDSSTNKRKRQDTQTQDQLITTLPPIITELSILKKVRLQVYKLRNKQHLITSLSSAIKAIPGIRNIQRPQLDMPVRWNSTYTMLEQYMAIKPAIDLVIIQYKDEFKNIELTDEDTTRIKQLLSILKLLNEASTEIQKDKRPIFMVNTPMTTYIYDQLSTLIRTTKWVQFKKGLILGRKKLEKYYPQKTQHLPRYHIYNFAILLDPRLKDVFFRDTLKWDHYDISFLIDSFKVLWNEYKQRYKPQRPITTSESSQTIEETPPKSLTERLYEQYGDTSINIDNKEVNAYLAEPRVGSNTDPAKWWHIYGQKYPVLSLMAQDFLAIMATSAPIEREFSKLSDIANNKKRNRLSANRVNQLICLKSWADINIEVEDIIEGEGEEDSE
jgi:hypothetical protein